MQTRFEHRVGESPYGHRQTDFLGVTRGGDSLTTHSPSCLLRPLSLTRKIFNDLYYFIEAKERLDRFHEDEIIVQRHDRGAPSRSLIRGFVFHPIFFTLRSSIGFVYEAHGNNSGG